MRKKSIWRTIVGGLLLTIIAGAGVLGVASMLQREKTKTYASYTVRRGNLFTQKSFSATLSVQHSETHQNTTQASMIREIYVKAGQQVKEGDKLMLLDNGEMLRAGLDGVVTSLRFGTSDWLWNNVQLIQISNLTNLLASLSVDEYDVRAISAGQQCTVEIIPLGVSLDAVITHVDRVSASAGQVASYTATAELTVPENVLPGMTASVTLPDQSAENVLLLDMAAISFDEDEKPFVLLKREDTYVQTPISIGLSDGMQVEILSGLQEGDTVWISSEVDEVPVEFSLADLYKQLVGEKIVIRDMTGGANTQRQRQSGAGSMPQGMTGVPDGAGTNAGEATPNVPVRQESGMDEELAEGTIKRNPRGREATGTDLREQRSDPSNTDQTRERNSNRNQNEEEQE